MCFGETFAQVTNLDQLRVKAIQSIQIEHRGSDYHSLVGIRFSNGTDQALRFRGASFDLSATRIISPQAFLSDPLLYVNWAVLNKREVLLLVGDEKVGRPIDSSILIPALEDLIKEKLIGSHGESMTRLLRLIKLDYNPSQKLSFQIVVPFGKAKVTSMDIGAGTALAPVTFDIKLDFLVGKAESMSTTQRLVEIVNIFGDPGSKYTINLVGEGEIGIKMANGWIYQKNMAVEYGYVPSLQREVLVE